MDEKLIIKKCSKVKGEDGYKTFSVCIKDETIEKFDNLSEETG